MLGQRGLKIQERPPELDVRVKVIFDENLVSMVFPRVKQFTFRASSDSPLEVAAKALAYRNDHPNLWKSYTF
jgi:hypothetical protein